MVQDELVTRFLGEVWKWLEELSHQDFLVIVHCKSLLGMQSPTPPNVKARSSEVGAGAAMLFSPKGRPKGEQHIARINKEMRWISGRHNSLRINIHPTIRRYTIAGKRAIISSLYRILYKDVNARDKAPLCQPPYFFQLNVHNGKRVYMSARHPATQLRPRDMARRRRAIPFSEFENGCRLF